MLSEQVQYQGKAGNLIFKMAFLEILASANQAGFYSDSRKYASYNVNALRIYIQNNAV